MCRRAELNRRALSSLAKVGALIAVVSACCFGTSVAFAQQTSPIVVSTNSGTSLFVDGIEPEKLPVGVGAGSTVCAPAPRVYKSEGERFIFQQWSDGTTDKCIVPTKPGAYRANYAHEVLVVVKSTAPGVQRSLWVPYAEPVKLEVPGVVQQSDDSRFRFDGWSDGETLFERTNQIAPVKPTTLEAKWVHEYQITIQAPDGADIKGSGWYTEGSSLLLRAPDILPGASPQERSKFAGWENASLRGSVLQNPQVLQAALKVDAPYVLRAMYDKQYLVEANSAVGTLKHDWIKDGSDVILEAPPIADVVPDQDRLVFKRWEGMEGLTSPKITGKVDKPISVTAVYERQVMLKINAPHGSAGEGWQKAGSVAPVSVPSTFSEMFLLNSTFTGFGGYPQGQSSIQVLVNEPTTVTALYRTEPNLPVLALVLLLPLLAVIVYLMGTRGGFDSLRERLERVRHAARARRKSNTPAADTGSLEISAKLPTRNGTHLRLPIGDELH
jgi:hypothetical protein